MSLYIRLSTNFFTHRKTLKLRAALKSTDAYWIPPRLWVYAAEHQPDGDFSGYSSEELAMLLGCDKHAQALLQALKDCGFIEENGLIHSWCEHNGFHKSFSERAKTAAKARWDKQKNRPPDPPEKREDMKGDDTSIAPSMLVASVKEWNPNSEQLRLGALFRMRPSTRWSAKELKAWKAITPIDEADLKELERHFAYERKPNDKFARHTALETLLNNFNTAVGWARSFKAPSMRPF